MWERGKEDVGVSRFWGFVHGLALLAKVLPYEIEGKHLLVRGVPGTCPSKKFPSLAETAEAFGQAGATAFRFCSGFFPRDVWWFPGGSLGVGRLEFWGLVCFRRCGHGQCLGPIAAPILSPGERFSPPRLGCGLLGIFAAGLGGWSFRLSWPSIRRQIGRLGFGRRRLWGRRRAFLFAACLVKGDWRSR